MHIDKLISIDMIIKIGGLLLKCNLAAERAIRDGIPTTVGLYSCNARIRFKKAEARNTFTMTLISYSTEICRCICRYGVYGGLEGILFVGLPQVIHNPPTHTTWQHVWKFLRLWFDGERLKQARDKFDE